MRLPQRARTWLWLAVSLVNVQLVDFKAIAAAPPATSKGSALSTYEQETLTAALEARGAELEPSPEGKWVEGVDVEALEVFEPRDPAPGWLNVFHSRSRDAIVEQELLCGTGKRYSAKFADESARNLRLRRQLSLVLVVPIRSKHPGRVRVLVITKDVWSMRLNSDYRLKNGVMEYLLLQPSEENLLGMHVRLSGQYIYDPFLNILGVSAAWPRLGGSRISALASASIITRRETGQVEGSAGGFTFGQPLYASTAKWAWGSGVVWDIRTQRRAALAPGGGFMVRRFDLPSTPEKDQLPYEYLSRQVDWQTAVTRSFGSHRKFDITLGAELALRRYHAYSLREQGYSAAQVAEFEQVALERSDARMGPFVQIESYTNRFTTLHDVETLGLTEDIRLGPVAVLKVYSGARAAQSTRDLIGITASASHTSALGTGYFRAWGQQSVELTPEHKDTDGIVQGGVRVVTPQIYGMRLVYDGGAINHYENYRNIRFSLGGDTRLRGYPSQQFVGRNLVVSNLELRTRPLKLLNVLFGLVGFYDVGSAYDDRSDLHPKQSLGIGARATAPQLQRVVGRLDVAFPISRPDPLLGERWGGVDIIMTLNGQAFPFPALRSSATATPLLAPTE